MQMQLENIASNDPATEILPILDSMEMALKVQTEDETIKNYVKGFEMIHKQLKGVFGKRRRTGNRCDR